MRKRYTLRGEITAASQSALTTALAALESAYATDGQDLTFYLNDGTTETAHKLVSSQSLTGTKVVKGPSYPDGKGYQYGTFRTYEIVIEADFPDASENILAWIETLSFNGVGGPKWRLLPTLTGPWQRQDVNLQTPYRVVQRGAAVGQFAFPVLPPPSWPAHEHRDERQAEKRGPKRVGASFSEYEVSWQYVFEAMVPLNGNPIIF